MEGEFPCNAALDYLEHNELKPTSECLPPGSASVYIPARKIRALFETEPNGLTLENLFLCPCRRCKEDGGAVDDRHFNQLREEELRGEYALIYALLIYIRRPGLIRKFQKHELKLQGTTYLRESDFEVFRREQIDSLHVLQRKVLDNQYSFLVRTLRPYSDITNISPKELLPINEDLKPKGEGTFAEVRCFQFQDDEYRSRDFGEHIRKFARKIFRQGMGKSAAKEWNNLQRLSKEENHPHLMVALGAYWHGNQFFILQEAAEQSLHDYLKGEGEAFESEELWEQMKGVAHGLATLHKIYRGTKIAYHQDLKPANILIVKRRLKIADFGLLEFKPVSLDDETGSTGIPNAHNAGYYAAPRQGNYTRDADIWSLGCIMSEVATHDVQGRDAVESYREARIANNPFNKDIPRFYYNGAVKNAVLKRHSMIHSCLQSREPTDGNTAVNQFQKKFYSNEYFSLLNSMLRHTQNPIEVLDVTRTGVPSAVIVAETIERLRSEAAPELVLDNRIENLSMEQRQFDVEALNTSLYFHLKSLKDVLNKTNMAKFSITTLTDLKQHIVNLQARQNEERRQRGLKRLEHFLENFEHFGEFIKDLPGVNELMAFIWGPTRFLLEVTDSRTDAFSDLLDLFEQVGRNQPSSVMYKQLLADGRDLTQILAAAYRDVIQMNKWLLIYFQQRRWAELYAMTWTRHKAKFLNIIGRMTTRFELVSSRASVSQFDSFLNESMIKDEQLVDTMHSDNLGRGQTVRAWLNPTEMENKQYHLQRIRSTSPDTCRWLLNDETFQEWFEPQGTNASLPRLLWLDGKPGAGKTVLASFIVEAARARQAASTILFFYFKHEDNDRDNFLSMARTLLMQILEQNPHTLDYFYSKCCNTAGTLLTSRALIEELLTLALGNCDSAYIVLDGLDECCSRKERGEIVKWFRETIENLPSEVRDQICCVFVSQDDSARKDYRDLARITVNARKNEDDIEAFSKVRSEELVSRLKISDKKVSEIAAFVSASADGIFLFAHLVWENLCGQISLDGLEQEMQLVSSDFDKLDKIYSRIMNTIMKKPSIAEHKVALRILGWLVCAKRSLKMHELQTMISIDLGRRAVDFEQRRLRVDLKDLCESLVDVREDGTIELVHLSAKFYLANCENLNIAAEQLRLATLCINYLNLPSFTAPYSKQAALAGEYGFMEYAILYWLRHMKAGLRSSTPEQSLLHEDLAESLGILVEQHWNNPTVGISEVSNRIRDMLLPLSASQNYPQIQIAVVSTDKDLKHFGDIRPEQSALNFVAMVSGIRQELERIFRSNPDQGTADDLELKYGPPCFRCPRFSCNYFTEGFPTPEEREKHVERHERPARCTDEHCRGSKIGFATKAQLERHLRENHPDTTAEQSNNFPTEEEIRESILENVSETEDEAEPEVDAQPEQDLVQPEVTAELATTVSGSSEQGLSAMPRPTYKRQKTKRVYNCTYCGKTFNKKFNFDSHLALHGSGQQQHKCPSCSKTCARYSDLVRHMKLHDPSSSVTCGGILSNGQRWGCGTNFARADILRKHHESKRGRNCIAQKNMQEQAGPSET